MMNSDNKPKKDNCVEFELALMRLVDGELSPEDRRATLKLVEDSDDGWRQCALAFIEEQVWQKEIGSSCLRRESSPPDSSDLLAALSTGGEGGKRDLSCGSAPPSGELPLPATQTEGDWRLVWAVAALVFVACSIGYWSETGRDRNSGGSGQLGEIPSISTGEPAPAYGHASLPTLADDRAQPTLVTNRPMRKDDLAGPFYVPQSNVWEQDSVVPLDIRRALEESGARLHHERGWMRLRLENGREVSVPYEDVEIVPVSLPSH